MVETALSKGTGMARLATVAQSQISVQPQLALPQHPFTAVRQMLASRSLVQHEHQMNCYWADHVSTYLQATSNSACRRLRMLWAQRTRRKTQLTLKILHLPDGSYFIRHGQAASRRVKSSGLFHGSKRHLGLLVESAVSWHLTSHVAYKGLLYFHCARSRNDIMLVNCGRRLPSSQSLKLGRSCSRTPKAASPRPQFVIVGAYNSYKDRSISDL
ncbi:hypothetical protein BDW67DRAFT_136627 [Aspergillus spinulosporus]